ncbi:ubiquinone biosynthesis O-methyltransferase, mitochondrial [Strongylocentrotus purpuratus]|uniref:Ubiquinone biosynthesis O-methyltransferase, mitochondrial n=1 Tax=Strongylocentrotus purpuratus TaxID=7668 RepID=A0A7M7PGX2_STRPU|nr:ubiquinone biosynthesis O-methyltransferase, mitochondrial [Strongylocentrotus purpuratus]
MATIGGSSSSFIRGTVQSIPMFRQRSMRPFSSIASRNLPSINTRSRRLQYERVRDTAPPGPGWMRCSVPLIQQQNGFSISLKHHHQFEAEQGNASTTMDPEELEKFRILSQQFWKESGDFQALHSMNDLRVPLIRDTLLNQKGGANRSNTRPLHGATIVDVGCGGGILAEPLARLGATVIGVDATPENIEVAQHHVSHDPTIRGNVKYICGTAEDLVRTEDEAFDALVCSEVLEHVSHKENFIKTCAELVKPGGSIFFTSVNQTWLSYALGIVMAEKVLGLVPDGTHDWNKFISPGYIQRVLEENDCSVRLTHGMMYNPATKRWSWMEDTSVNYAICAVKRTVTGEDQAAL